MIIRKRMRMRKTEHRMTENEKDRKLEWHKIRKRMGMTKNETDRKREHGMIITEKEKDRETRQK
jgi:hypothetical protein